MGSLEVVVDGQFGSCGKGAVAAWRAKESAARGDSLLAIRVAGPNAGHTVIGLRGEVTDADSNPTAPTLCEPLTPGVTTIDDSRVMVPARYAWRLRHVPVAAVVHPEATLALAAGSEIDLDVLLNEIDLLTEHGYDVGRRLVVDAEATIINAEHQFTEKYGRYAQDDAGAGIASSLGSTGKGIGAARADRIWREPGIRLADQPDAVSALLDRGCDVRSSEAGGAAQMAHGLLRQSAGNVHIEGTQGYGLGLHAGFYPYGTSSDCRAIDFLAMAGINPWQLMSSINSTNKAWRLNTPDLTVWLCLRPYPIRVGGNSGPLKDETTWEVLGLPVEHTTVTQKVRRVGLWDGQLARRAIQANGGPGGAVKIALTMFDQLLPNLAGHTHMAEIRGETNNTTYQQVVDRIEWFERECGQPLSYIGTGPDSGIDLDRRRSALAAI